MAKRKKKANPDGDPDEVGSALEQATDDEFAAAVEAIDNIRGMRNRIGTIVRRFKREAKITSTSVRNLVRDILAAID